MSKDLLRIAHTVLSEIDLRVIPEGVAVQVAATRKLIEAELAPAPEPAKVAKKVTKKKVAKKTTKKKVAKKKVSRRR